MRLRIENEFNEILVVQIKLGSLNVRLINAYGPQDTDTSTNRLNFWTSLESEINAAKSQNCCVIIEMDANSKLGRDILPGDPNLNMDNNGYELYNLLVRQSLHMLNKDYRCSGVITRYRETKIGVEQSILDYMIVSDELFEHFCSMYIDERRDFALTSYASKKGQKKVKKSDHNLIFAKFSLKYKKVYKKIQDWKFLI